MADGFSREAARQTQMKKLFTESFAVMDIAEPLLTFDDKASAADVMNVMKQKELTAAGIGKSGDIAGYCRMSDVAEGEIGDFLMPFEEEIVLDETASIAQAIECLAASEYCFIRILGAVGAVVTRQDIEKPPVRMWLFGMITIIENFGNRTIDAMYPGNRWREQLSPARIRKAEMLQEERRRRNEQFKLVRCLQFSDKAHILLKDPDMRKDFGFESRREGERALKELESLRNNLAHSSDLLTANWDAIVVMSRRLEKIMTRI